jgi:hypothetical protein
MQITARVDVKPVQTYYGELATVLRQSLPRTLKMEAAATVRRAMQMVASSKADRVRAGAIRDGMKETRDASGMKITVNVGKGKGRTIWLRDPDDYGKWYNIGRWDGTLSPLTDHDRKGWLIRKALWSAAKAVWQKNINVTKNDVKKRLGARGVTAKSWFDILEKLNSDQSASVSAFVQRARPISGKSRQVGFALELGSGSAQPQVVVTNTSGVAIATGGERKLASAIAIRRKFFMDSFDKGFLTDARFVAKNYPWAKVTA